MADVILSVRPPDPPSRGQLYLQLRVVVRQLALAGARLEWLQTEVAAAFNTATRGQLPRDKE